MKPLCVFRALLLCLFLQHAALAAAGPADLSGRMAFQVSGDRVRIEIAAITNNTSNVQTGTLYVTMRLTEQPSPFGSGYNVAREALTFGAGAASNGTLAPGRGFVDLVTTTDFSRPPAGLYYVHFFTSQFPDLDTSLDEFTFSDRTQFGAAPGPDPQVVPLALNGSVSASISAPGEIDTYELTVGQPGELTVQSFGTLDTVGTLLDADGDVIAFNDDADVGLNFSITVDLVPGVYRLQVGGFLSATGDYQVTSTFIPASAPPPPPPPPPPPAGDVEITGTIAYNTDSSGDQVTILMDALENNRATQTSPLTVQLVALTDPSSNSGFRLATLDIGVLPAGGALRGVQRTTAFTPPPAGTYSVALVVLEDTAVGETEVTRRLFPGTARFGGGSTGGNGGGGGDGGGGGSTGLPGLFALLAAVLRRRGATCYAAVSPRGARAGQRHSRGTTRPTGRVCALAVAVAGAVTGCSTTLTNEEIDRVVFAGDVSPRVTSAQAFSGRLDNLAPNESLVVARGPDGSGALSQPSPATLVVMEPQLEDRRNDPDLWLSRCDPDSDGMLDRHCPELFAALSRGGQIDNQKFVSFQSWYTINKDPKVDRDYWGSTQYLNTADAIDRHMPVTLKLLAVNLGNKPFHGDIDIYVNIPPRVTLGEMRLVSKVKSRSGAKGLLDTGLMTLGALYGVYVPAGTSDSFLDDYAAVESDASFSVSAEGPDRARVTVQNIDVNPNEGVTIEYDALYAVIDD